MYNLSWVRTHNLSHSKRAAITNACIKNIWFSYKEIYLYRYCDVWYFGIISLLSNQSRPKVDLYIVTVSKPANVSTTSYLPYPVNELPYRGVSTGGSICVYFFIFSLKTIIDRNICQLSISTVDRRMAKHCY